MKRLKAVLPWVVQAFAGSWLRDRAFHAPEGDVEGLAASAQGRAVAKAQARGVNAPTPAEWWRAVEETQADYVTAGVLVRL